MRGRVVQAVCVLLRGRGRRGCQLLAFVAEQPEQAAVRGYMCNMGESAAVRGYIRDGAQIGV